jgi:hypothetical protein
MPKDFDNWEHKTFPLTEVKVDDAEGEFTGYASIFGVVDSYGDVVQPGAFKRTLKNKGKWPLFYAHNAADLPVGTITGAEDDKGLRIKGKLSMRTQKAQDVRALMQDGAIDGLSIGYQAVREGRDEETGNRLLKEINLWEVSLCPLRFEACPGARADAIKAAAEATDEKEDEKDIDPQKEKTATAPSPKESCDTSESASGPSLKDAADALAEIRASLFSRR